MQDFTPQYDSEQKSAMMGSLKGPDKVIFDGVIRKIFIQNEKRLRLVKDAEARSAITGMVAYHVQTMLTQINLQQLKYETSVKNAPQQLKATKDRRLKMKVALESTLPIGVSRILNANPGQFGEHHILKINFFLSSYAQSMKQMPDQANPPYFLSLLTGRQKFKPKEFIQAFQPAKADLLKQLATANTLQQDIQGERRFLQVSDSQRKSFNKVATLTLLDQKEREALLQEFVLNYKNITLFDAQGKITPEGATYDKNVVNYCLTNFQNLAVPRKIIQEQIKEDDLGPKQLKGAKFLLSQLHNPRTTIHFRDFIYDNLAKPIAGNNDRFRKNVTNPLQGYSGLFALGSMYAGYSALVNMSMAIGSSKEKKGAAMAFLKHALGLFGGTMSSFATANQRDNIFVDLVNKLKDVVPNQPQSDTVKINKEIKSYFFTEGPFIQPDPSTTTYEPLFNQPEFYEYLVDPKNQVRASKALPKDFKAFQKNLPPKYAKSFQKFVRAHKTPKHVAERIAFLQEYLKVTKTNQKFEKYQKLFK